MSSVFAANGLGVFDSSLTQANGFGASGDGRVGRGNDAASVNVATGNLVIQSQDDYVAATGLDLALLRSYNSLGQLTDDNGDNWQLALVRKLTNLPATGATTAITRIGGDGFSQTFSYDSSLGYWVSHAGGAAADTLKLVSSQWIYDEGSSGLRETYDATGMLLTAKDRDGNLQSYTFAGSLLTKIVDASGQTTYLDYSGTQLTQIRYVGADAVQSVRVRYTYDTSNRLYQVKVDLTNPDDTTADASTYFTTYTYDGTSKRVASITQSDNSSVSFTYVLVGSDYRVYTVTTAVASSVSRAMTFAYDTTARTTSVTDALGNLTKYYYDTSSRLTKVETYAGTTVVKGTTSYQYSSTGNITKVSVLASSETFDYYYTYDTNDNLLLSWDELGNTVARTYGSANELLTETIYLTPDADLATGGNSATNLPGDGKTTRYVYDSEYHLRFTVSADGRVQERRYKSNGDLSSEYRYTGVPYSGTDWSETALAGWVSGLADKSQVQITTYGRDARGQLTYIRRYAYADSTGSGISNQSNYVSTYSSFVYDRSGALLQQIDSVEGSSDYETTDYLRDGLGRIFQVTQTGTDEAGSKSRVTLTTYDDAYNKIIITASNGLLTTHTYNKAGELISVNRKSSGNTNYGTTSNAYDAMGRLRIVTDPTDVQTHLIYDEQGFKVAEINAEKEMTEYVYDTSGRLSKTIRYATRVTAVLPSSGTPVADTKVADLRPTADATNDRSSYLLYDTAGRLLYTLVDDIEGTALKRDLTKRVYDGAGRVVQEIAYAKRVLSTTALTRSGINSFVGNDNNLDAANDRSTRYFYDGDGHRIGVLNPEGYLTESKYDAGGRLTETIAYAARSPSDQWATGLLGDLRPAADMANDQHAYTVYDDAGRKTADIDAQGLLTTYYYDRLSRVIEQRRFNGAVTYSTTATRETLESAAITATPTGLNRYHTTVSTYDAQGQLVQVNQNVYNNGGTGAYVLRTEYEYEADSGDLLTVKVGTNNATYTRVTQYRRDELGRITQTLDGEGSKALAAAGSDPAAQDAVWSDWDTHSVYDKAGRVVRQQDANSHWTRYYYDGEGRVRYTVNNRGEVSESAYNAFGEVTRQAQYSTRISTTGLDGGYAGTADPTAITDPELQSQVTPSTFPTAQDRSTTTTYTRRGQVDVVTDPRGFISDSTYNAFGQRSQELADYGATPSAATRRTFSWSYDRRGLTVTATRSNISTESYGYDAFGRAISHTDGRTATATTAYDRIGRVVTTADALGGTSAFSYDTLGRTLTQTDPLGNVTTYRYDDNTGWSYVTTPEGIETKTWRDPEGEKVQVSVNNNGVWENTYYAYDQNGRVTKVTDPLNFYTTATYDQAGRLMWETDKNRVTTRYTYDAADRVSARLVDPTDQDGDGATDNAAGLNLATSYTYDAFGGVTQATDANGIVTETVFDKRGQQTAVIRDTAGLKLATVYTYNALGKVLTVKEGVQASGATGAWDVSGAAARTTTYAYDSLGRRTQQTEGAGSLNLNTYYAYDANSNLTRKTDANGQLWRYAYDADNHQHFAIDPLGEVTEYCYDGEGRKTSEIQHSTVLDTDFLYDGITDDAVAHLLNAVFTQDLNTDTSGFTNPDGTYITYGSGKLSLTSGNRSSPLFPAVAGTRTYVPSQGPVGFRAEVNTGTNSANRYFEFGANGNGNMVAVAFHGTQAELGKWMGNSGVGTIPLGTISDNTTYVVEVELAAWGGQVWLYKKGQTRSAGYTASFSDFPSTAAKDAWSTNGFMAYICVGQTPSLGTPGCTLTVDNIVEYNVDASELPINQPLYPGQSIYSLGGAYRLTYKNIDGINGQLVLYTRAGEVRWQSTSGALGSALFQGDGNFVLYTASGGVVWSSNTWQYPGSRLVLQQDGSLAIYSSNGTAVWSTGSMIDASILSLDKPLYGGQSIYSSDGAYQLVYQQTDGDLVMYDARTGRRVWASGTAGQPVGRVVLRSSDGVLAIYNKVSPPAPNDPPETVLWTSTNTGTPASRLVVQIDGNVVIYSSTDSALWATGAQVAVSSKTLRTMRHVYDRDGREIYTIDPAGSVTDYRYDANGRVSQQTRYAKPLGRQLVTNASGYGGSVAGWTYAVSAASASTAGFGVQGNALLTSNRDAQQVPAFAVIPGEKFKVSADFLRGSADYTGAYHRPMISLQYTYADGHVDWEWYGAAGDPSVSTVQSVSGTVTIPNGVVAAQIWIQIDAWFNNSPLPDSNGLITDPNNTGSWYFRNAYVARADGSSEAWVDNISEGREALEWRLATSADDQITSYTYDKAGRLTETIDAERYSERYTYDNVGNRKTLTDKNGNTWTYFYDAANRMYEEDAPSAKTYSGTSGTATSTVLKTRLVYDTLGNVRARIENYNPSAPTAARVTRYVYDALGRQVRTANAGTFTLDGISYGSMVGVYNANADMNTSYGTTRSSFESVISLYNDTWYDAAGNAVVAHDANSRYNYKVYDAAGRVKYEMDPERGVTAYNYDSNGNVTSVSRYSAAVNENAETASGAGDSLLALEQVTTTTFNDGNAAARTAALAAQARAVTLITALSTSGSRAVTTVYDAANRKIQVTQPAVYYYLSDAAGNVLSGTSTASPTTTYSYDAFSEVTAQSELRNPNAGEWITTHFGYDAAGRQTDQLDALGYYTRNSYDAFGRVSQSIQYAKAQSVPTDAGGRLVFAALNPVTTSVSANDAAGYDRVVKYGYDRLDRQTSQTRANIRNWALDGNANLVQMNQDAITTTAYDGVGNVLSTTDAQGTTVNIYNALGRLVGVKAPVRTSTVDNTGAAITATPLTAYRYDALGNRLAEIHYASPSLQMPADGTTPAGQDATNDQYTYFSYDILGRVLSTTDAQGKLEYQSYDAFGHVGRTWRTQTDAIGGASLQQTDFYGYDDLGHQIETRHMVASPLDTASRPVESEAVTFNAFGEQISRGSFLNGVGTYAEWAEYDPNGRLWQTNAGGVTKAYRYDLQGHATQEALVQGTAAGGNQSPIAAHLSATSAVASATAIRTDTVYDLLGRVVSRRDPYFDQAPLSPADGGLISIANVSAATVTAASSSTVSVPDGNETSETIYNKVSLSWPSMSSLGTGAVNIYIVCQAVDGTVFTYQASKSSAEAVSGATVEWNDPPLFSQVISASVRKLINGQWQLVRATGVSGVSVGVILPDAYDAHPLGAKIYYRLGTSGDYSFATTTSRTMGEFTAQMPSGLTAGTYNYYLDIEETQTDLPQAVGERVSGTFTVDSGGAITGYGAPATATARLQAVHTQTVDRWGNILSVTDPRNTGWVTQYRYNDLNQIERTTQPSVEVWNADTTHAASAPTSYGYFDTLGRSVAVQDANGNLTRRSYDAVGHLIQERRPDASLWSWGYDVLGRQNQETDGNGSVLNKQYDRLNRLTKDQRSGYAAGDERYTVYAYDELGNRVSSTNALGESLRSRYDTRGHLVQQLDPLWDASLRSQFKTTYEYDKLGRKTKETNGLADYQTWTYDDFNRLIGHRDLAGSTYTYTYDEYGRLKQQTSSVVAQAVSTGGESLQYSYYANGWLQKLTDTSPSSSVGTRYTDYRYDLNGNIIEERVYDGTIGTRYQDNHSYYDALGRLERVRGDSFGLAFTYDAVGNRRRIYAESQMVDLIGANPPMDHWYLYDSQNRIVAAAGAKSGNSIVNATLLGYDLAGNRAWASYLGSTSYTNYVYNADHQIKQILSSSTTSGGTVVNDRLYDRAGRLTSSTDIGTTTTRRRLYYNANGWLISQFTDKSTNYGSTWTNNSKVRYSSSTYSDDPVNNVAAIATDVGNYNAEGLPSQYTAYVYSGGSTSTYAYSYLKLGAGYKERTATVTAGATSGTTTTTYDKHGYALTISNPNGDPKSQTLLTDSQGHILLKKIVRQNNSPASQAYYFASGTLIGSVGFIEGSGFDYNYTPVSSSYPPSSPSQYVVQSNGESLKSIASTFFGDSSLWYLIADANGLTGAESLVIGQSLTIPNQVSNLHNNATTFKPYNPGDILGDTSPALPAPPPPPRHHCNALATIVIVAVVIVATIFTAGAATVGLAAGFGSIMSSGAAVMAGSFAAAGASSVAAGLGAAALGGAVGSAAGQLTGMALGVQDKFSWSQVAVSGLTSMATAGIGAGIGKVAQGPFLSAGSGWGGATRGAMTGFANAVAGQGINVALGQQDQFSWSAVAAGSVTGGIGGALGDADPLNKIAGKGGAQRFNVGQVLGATVKSTAYGIANRGIQVALQGHGKIDFANIAADSFGNALGNSIVGAMQDHQFEKQTDSILEEAGFSGEKGDTQQSRLAVRAMLEAGGTPEQIQQILAREDIRNAYDRLDSATGGGISIEEAADRVLNNAPGSSSSMSRDIAGEMPEVIVTAGRGPLSGEGIFGEAIGGGVELLDSFSNLYQENELLATIGFAGVSAVIGGPTKTFLKRLTGDFGNSLVERGAEAFGGLTARVVTDIAVKNKWTVALSIAGFSGEADASIIGTAAGGLGSIAVETALGAGAGQVVDRVNQLRTKLPRYSGPKPGYIVNPPHVPGPGFNPRKTPLPNDAEYVFKNAVPNDPSKPTAWFGRNANGDTYRFSMGNDGTAHFSGIDGVGDGTRNLTKYAKNRLDGK